MTIRCRPNRLGYLLAALTTFVLVFYLFSSQYHAFSETQLRQWDAMVSGLDDQKFDPEADGEPQVPLVLHHSHQPSELTEQGLRITLAQLYENARTDLLGLDEELGEHEDEIHEDYIYRLAKFVGEHFPGSPAQLYLRKMLGNLDMHIAPPLLRSGVRRGIIQITDDKGSSRGGGQSNHEHALRRAAIQPQLTWEANVWTANELNRAYAALARGSNMMSALWSNLNHFEGKKTVIKYASLMLWGGAFAEEADRVTSLSPLSVLADTATSVLPSELAGPRSSLQPLTPAPPSPPRFIPPSLDPNWALQSQSETEKEVALILTQALDGQGLDPDLILAKAFHPVTLDIMAVLSRRVEQEITHCLSEGKKYDSKEVEMADGPLLNEAVDRYLRVQYGSSLDQLILTAGDEAVRMGDILLLPSSEE